MKCDETQPACMNCLKTRGVCDGYYIKPRKNQSKKKAPKTKETANKSQEVTTISTQSISEAQNTSVLATVPSVAISLLIEPNINTPDFTNEHQHAYFEEWQYLTQAPLGGYTSPKLWTIFMPQLTRQSPALRYAAMSIGAMSRALALRCHREDPLKTHHYNNAVDFYCRALRLQRQAGMVNIREVLVTSILFISFEALRGEKKAALAHVTHGFSLLRDILGDEAGRLQYLAPHPTELIAEILRLYVQVGVQTQTVLSSQLGQEHTSAEVLTQSIRLKGHNMEAFGNTMNKYLRPKMTAENIPSEIKSVQEAEECWEAVDHFISATGFDLISILDSLSLPTATDDEEVDRFFQALGQHPTIIKFIKSSQTQLNVFEKAFSLLFSQATPYLNKDHFIRLVQIRIEHLSLKMYSLFPVRYSLTVALTLTPLCRELNDLCETMLREQYANPRGPSDRFSMRSTLTWHLVFIAMNCRDAMVRDNAIRILDVYPRRDCLIDSRALQAVAERNRTLEIENASYGDTPEDQWRRLCRRVFLFEDAGRRIVFRSMRPTEEGWALKEETAVSDSWTDEHPDPDKEWVERELTGKTLILQWGRTSDVFAEVTYPPGAGSKDPDELCKGWMRDG